MHMISQVAFGIIGVVSGISVPPSSDLDIPTSASTVSVKVIHSMVGRGVPAGTLFTPVINGSFDEVPFYAFLLEHTGRDGTTEKFLFDSGLRKDVENSVPETVAAINSSGATFDPRLDVPDVLAANGIPLSSIDSIFWSHWHYDHVGDPSRFPTEVDIIVGPGYSQAFMPGYPTNPAAVVFESALANRTVREVNFANSSVNIGGLRALDWFGDGSFYLLETPGHAIGHMSALARTTPDTFVLMGGDLCHHPGLLRPTVYIPLPTEIHPSPFQHLSSECAAEFAENIHPAGKRDEPYMEPSLDGIHLNPALMSDTIGLVHRLDANPNIFIILAHDISLLGAIEFFPQAINDWKSRGWKETTRWAFIGDFDVS